MAAEVFPISSVARSRSEVDPSDRKRRTEDDTGLLDEAIETERVRRWYSEVILGVGLRDSSVSR